MPRPLAPTLPVEVVVQVLRRMDSKREVFGAALVCRQWARAAVPLLWQRIECYTDDWDSFKGLFLRPRRLRQDYRRDILALTVTASSSPWVDGEHRLPNVRTLVAGCTSLLELHITTPSLNDDDMWVLSTSCPHLQAISFVSGVSPFGRVTDEGLVALARNCRGLRRVGIRCMSAAAVSDRGIAALAEQARGRLLLFGLELCGPRTPLLHAEAAHAHAAVPLSAVTPGLPMHAQIQSVTAIGAASVAPVPITAVAAAPSAAPRFGPPHRPHPLASAGASSAAGPPEFNSADRVRRLREALVRLISGNPDLDTLLLDWPDAMDDALAAAAASLRGLRRLRVGNTQAGASLARIIERNPRLDNVAMFEIGTKEMTLRTLLEPLRSDSAAAAAAVLPPAAPIASVSAGSSTPSAAAPEAAATNNTASSSSASDAALAHEQVMQLAAPHEPLRALDLDGIGFLGELIATTSSLFTNLTTLKLSPSRRAASIHRTLDDAQLARVASACPGLEVLHVPLLADAQLEAFAAACPRLRDLDVIDGYRITDRGVLALARSCPSVAWLALGSAWAVTDASVVPLARTLGPRLRKLALPFAATGITEAAVATIAQCCPMLRGLANVPVLIGFPTLLKLLPTMERLLVVSLCVAPPDGHGSPAVTQGLFLSPLQLEQLRRACKRLRHLVQNA
nr:hypothetical protein HK105_006582 [Polyrhizophydium stewartii]